MDTGDAMTGAVQRWLSHRWAIVAADVLVVLTVYTAALVIRFDGQVPSFYASRFASFLPLIVAAYVIVGLLARTYTSATSLVKVATWALLTGISTIVVAMFWPNPIPRSVLALGAIGSVVGLTGVRALAWKSRRGFA